MASGRLQGSLCPTINSPASSAIGLRTYSAYPQVGEPGLTHGGRVGGVGAGGGAGLLGGGPPPADVKLSSDDVLVKSTKFPPSVKQAALFGVVRLATFPLLCWYVAPAPSTNRRTTSQSSGHGFPAWGGRPSLHSFPVSPGGLTTISTTECCWAERVTLSPGARSSAAGGA